MFLRHLWQSQSLPFSYFMFLSFEPEYEYIHKLYLITVALKRLYLRIFTSLQILYWMEINFLCRSCNIFLNRSLFFPFLIQLFFKINSWIMKLRLWLFSWPRFSYSFCIILLLALFCIFHFTRYIIICAQIVFITKLKRTI